jgi:hypothetical protein
VKSMHILMAALLAAFLALLPAVARAADDHGHDHDTPAAADAAALPRFAAVSEAFELVGILNGKRLTLYLDRMPDNAPVKEATLELELGGVKVPVQPHGEGQFEVTLTQELTRGVIPVTATVSAGNETDLLAGELDLHDAHGPEAEHRHGWKEYAGWAAATLIVLTFGGFAVKRLRAQGRRSGGAA